MSSDNSRGAVPCRTVGYPERCTVRRRGRTGPSPVRTRGKDARWNGHRAVHIVQFSERPSPGDDLRCNAHRRHAARSQTDKCATSRCTSTHVRTISKGIPCLGQLSGDMRIESPARRSRSTAGALSSPRTWGHTTSTAATQGFHTINWRAEPIRMDDRAGVEMTHTSPDGHEGYPGTLEVRMQYVLTNDNQLVMEYWAKTDKPTHLNLTNHAYWNLAGAGSGNVLEHVVLDQRRQDGRGERAAFSHRRDSTCGRDGSGFPHTSPCW